MNKMIKFRLAAWTDMAGKAPDPNEDSFFVDDNLSDDNADGQTFVTDKEVAMSEYGAIMVVADGMGGMNAGEVASKIATDTAAEFFAPGRINANNSSTHTARCRYMEQTIIESNRRIIADQKRNQAHEGMGSTMIMAWLVGDELSLTWIGDSRAYRFNPNDGLEPLSKDHSYVQGLVDSGKISYEQAFVHPQGNIVVKSLGDPKTDPEPESLEEPVKVNQGDIILLCSDGLSGVLFDRAAVDSDGYPISKYNIEDIIAANQNSMETLRKELFKYAELSNWYDNVTTLLCQITEMSDDLAIQPNNTESSNEKASASMSRDTIGSVKITKSGLRKWFLIVSVLLIGLAVWKFWPTTETEDGSQSGNRTSDSLYNIVQTLKNDSVNSILGINPAIFKFADYPDSLTSENVNLLKFKFEYFNYLKDYKRCCVIDTARLLTGLNECVKAATSTITQSNTSNSISDALRNVQKKYLALRDSIGKYCTNLGQVDTNISGEKLVADFTSVKNNYNASKKIEDKVSDFKRIVKDNNNRFIGDFKREVETKTSWDEQSLKDMQARYNKLDHIAKEAETFCKKIENEIEKRGTNGDNDGLKNLLAKVKIDTWEKNKDSLEKEYEEIISLTPVD